MYSIQLKGIDGKVIEELNFPEAPEEVTLQQYAGFNAAFKKMAEWEEALEVDERVTKINGKEVISTKYQLELIRHIFNCVYEFTGSKHIDKLSVGSFNRYFKKLMGAKKIEEIDLNTSEENLLTIYTNCLRVIKGYKPKIRKGEDAYFEHKGKRFKIPSFYVDAVTKQDRFDTIPTGKAVEVLEAVRAWENNKEFDESGGIYYTTVLKLIAVFSRKIVKKNPEELEAFPTSTQGIEKFINDRVIFFKDIDMCTALDIEFFFSGGTIH